MPTETALIVALDAADPSLWGALAETVRDGRKPLVFLPCYDDFLPAVPEWCPVTRPMDYLSAADVDRIYDAVFQWQKTLPAIETSNGGALDEWSLLTNGPSATWSWLSSLYPHVHLRIRLIEAVRAALAAVKPTSFILCGEDPAFPWHAPLIRRTIATLAPACNEVRRKDRMPATSKGRTSTRAGLSTDAPLPTPAAIAVSGLADAPPPQHPPESLVVTGAEAPQSAAQPCLLAQDGAVLTQEYPQSASLEQQLPETQFAVQREEQREILEAQGREIARESKEELRTKLQQQNFEQQQQEIQKQFELERLREEERAKQRRIEQELQLAQEQDRLRKIELERQQEQERLQLEKELRERLRIEEPARAQEPLRLIEGESLKRRLAEWGMEYGRETGTGNTRRILENNALLLRSQDDYRLEMIPNNGNLLFSALITFSPQASGSVRILIENGSIGVSIVATPISLQIGSLPATPVNRRRVAIVVRMAGGIADITVNRNRLPVGTLPGASRRQITIEHNHTRAVEHIDTLVKTARTSNRQFRSWFGTVGRKVINAIRHRPRPPVMTTDISSQPMHRAADWSAPQGSVQIVKAARVRRLPAANTLRPPRAAPPPGGSPVPDRAVKFVEFAWKVRAYLWGRPYVPPDEREQRRQLQQERLAEREQRRQLQQGRIAEREKNLQIRREQQSRRLEERERRQQIHEKRLEQREQNLRIRRERETLSMAPAGPRIDSVKAPQAARHTGQPAHLKRARKLLSAARTLGFSTFVRIVRSLHSGLWKSLFRTPGSGEPQPADGTGFSVGRALQRAATAAIEDWASNLPPAPNGRIMLIMRGRTGAKWFRSNKYGWMLWDLYIEGLPEALIEACREKGLRLTIVYEGASPVFDEERKSYATRYPDIVEEISTVELIGLSSAGRAKLTARYAEELEKLIQLPAFRAGFVHAGVDYFDELLEIMRAEIPSRSALFDLRYVGWHNLFTYARPKIIFGGRMELRPDVNCAAHKLDIKTTTIKLGVGEEMLSSFIAYRRDGTFENQAYPDLTLVWGDEQKRFLANRLPEFKGRIETSGRTRNDSFINEVGSIDRQDVRRRANISEEKRIVVYGATSRTRYGLWPGAPWGACCISPQTMEDELIALVEAARRVPDTLIVVKPHPADSLDLIRKFIDDIGDERIRLITDQAGFHNLEILSISDIFVSSVSSMFAESVMCNCVAVNVWTPDVNYLYEENRNTIYKAISVPVNTMNELTETVVDLLNNPARRNAELDRMRTEVEKFFGSMDGRNADRAAQLGLSMIEDPASPTVNSPAAIDMVTVEPAAAPMS